MMYTYAACLARCRLMRGLAAMVLLPMVFAGCSSLGVKSAYLDATEVGTAFPSTVPASTQIYTKVAGIAFSLDILAGVYMTNNTTIQSSVAAGFPYGTIYATGQSYIDFVDWNKSGGSCGAVGDANQVSGVTVSTSGVGTYGGASSAAYNWTGAEQGRKTYTFTASQATANVKVRIYGYNSSQNVATTVCSTDSFTIRPATFSVSSNPTSASTQAAGSNYTMSVTAVNNAGTTTTAYTGTPVLTTTGITDWKAVAISSGSFSGSFGAAVSGVSSGSSFNYSDFGQLTIPVGAIKDSTYVSGSGSGDVAGGDCVSGSSSNTLSGGLYGCNIANSATASTPRFIAHHYAVNHVITPACASTFTYFGQPMMLSMTIDALNASGGRLTRLTESAPNKPSFTWTQMNGGSSTTSPLTMPAANLKWSADSTYGTSSGGEYFTSTITTAPYSQGAVSVATTRPSVTPPASSSSPPDYESFNLITNASDANITSCNGVAASGTMACSAAATKLRYGVLKLTDGQGTSLTPATVQVTAQYWNGSSFVTNTDDSCTVINFNTGTIASSTTPRPTAKNTSSTLSSGVGALMLNATLAGNMAIRLGGADNNCVSATAGTVTSANALSGYLGGVSCSSSYDKDPSAQILFGTLRSTYIYRAEKF